MLRESRDDTIIAFLKSLIWLIAGVIVVLISIISPDEDALVFVFIGGIPLCVTFVYKLFEVCIEYLSDYFDLKREAKEKGYLK